jgi:rare lipoprotein A
MIHWRAGKEQRLSRRTDDLSLGRAGRQRADPAPLLLPRRRPSRSRNSASGHAKCAVAAPAAASGSFVVQVGAVSDQARAQQYQQRLSQQFGVPGRVEQNGAVWRIQMGPFASKSQASALQQRLQSEAQLQSFIAVAK